MLANMLFYVLKIHTTDQGCIQGAEELKVLLILLEFNWKYTAMIKKLNSLIW